MMEGKEFGDRQKVDAALVAANRFLKPGISYIPDAAIENARVQLRAAYPPACLDTEEDNRMWESVRAEARGTSIQHVR
jgi:hypothetical protein